MEDEVREKIEKMEIIIGTLRRTAADLEKKVREIEGRR